MCPFEAWGTSCTPLLGIGGVVVIMLGPFPTIGLPWTTSTMQTSIASCDSSRMLEPLSRQSTWDCSYQPFEPNVFGTSMTMSSRSMTSSNPTSVVVAKNNTRNDISFKIS